MGSAGMQVGTTPLTWPNSIKQRNFLVAFACKNRDVEIALRPDVCAEIEEKTRLPGVVIHKDHNLVKEHN